MILSKKQHHSLFLWRRLNCLTTKSWYQKTELFTAKLFSYSFHVPCIILSNVYFYIPRSMFPFLFNRSQSKVSVVNQMSHLFLEAQKYFFAFFNFMKMVIFTERCFDVDQRCETQRWK